MRLITISAKGTQLRPPDTWPPITMLNILPRQSKPIGYRLRITSTRSTALILFNSPAILAPLRRGFFFAREKSADTSSSLRDAPRCMPRSAGRVDTSCGCRVAGRTAWHVSAWTVWFVITRVITFCGYQLWLSRGGSHCYFYNVTFFLVMLPQCYLFFGQKVTIQKVSKRAVS